MSSAKIVYASGEVVNIGSRKSLGPFLVRGSKVILLGFDDIVKNKVKTLNQFKVLGYLKDNLDVSKFRLFLYDKDTIKVIDGNDDVGYFKYSDVDNKVIFYEEELNSGFEI